MRSPGGSAWFLLVVVLFAAPFVIVELLHRPPAPEPAAPAPPGAPPPAPGAAPEESIEAPEPVETDPWRRVSAVVRRNVELDPVLREYEFAVADREPFLVYVARKGVPDADAVAAKAMDLLQAIYAEVLDKLGPPLGLRPLAEFPDDDMRVLRVLLMAREPFDEYHQKIGNPVWDATYAYYSDRTRWLTIRLLPPAVEGRLRLRGFSLVVEQLLHVWRKAGVEAALGESVPWTDQRLQSRLECIAIGLPLFLGAAREREGGGYELGIPDDQGLADWAELRSARLSEWSLPEILDVTSFAELQQRAARKGLADAGSHEVLFVAQSAALCNFLWHFEDGKYRPKFLACLKEDLRGNSGPDVFRTALGLGPGSEALAPLAAEFADFVKQSLEDPGR